MNPQPLKPEDIDPDLRMAIGYRYAAQERRQQIEDQRNDPLLRIEAYKLVVSIGQDIIRDHAHDLATKRHGRMPTMFETDVEADKLVHALLEFIAQSYFNLEPDEPAIAKAYQLDEFHASDWFDVDVNVTGNREIVATSRN